METFTIEQAGTYTSTKRTARTWPAVLAAVAEFVNATTTCPATRANLTTAVLAAAGTGEWVQLPNRKRLAIIDN